MRSTELYIDLGTANTLVYAKKKGFLLNEPSVITFKNGPGNTKYLYALGKAAKLMIGKTPSHLTVVRPLREGVIADFDSTSRMLQSFIERIKEGMFWFRPKMVISLPCKVTHAEKEAVEEVGFSLGARQVHLIQEPVAAAIGAGIPIQKNEGNMVIDIGGGTTEIAIISSGGIIYANAVRVGGNDMDEKIIQVIRQKYNFVIGEQTAEFLKIHLGNALLENPVCYMEVRGKDLTTGLPSKLMVSSHDVYEALDETLRAIFQATQMALENTPPEVAGDLADRGIVLAGGGALLKNIDRRFRDELGLPIAISHDPLLSIAFGGAKALEDDQLLESIKL